MEWNFFPVCLESPCVNSQNQPRHGRTTEPWQLIAGGEFLFVFPSFDNHSQLSGWQLQTWVFYQPRLRPWPWKPGWWGHWQCSPDLGQNLLQTQPKFAKSIINIINIIYTDLDTKIRQWRGYWQWEWFKKSFVLITSLLSSFYLDTKKQRIWYYPELPNCISLTLNYWWIFSAVHPVTPS